MSFRFLVFCLVSIFAVANILVVSANTSNDRVHGDIPPPCDGKLGTLIWKSILQADPTWWEPDLSDMSLAQGKILIGAHNSALAMDALTGATAWNRTYPARIRKKSTTVFNNSLSYWVPGLVGEEDAALRISDGTTVWKFNSGSSTGGWTANPKTALEMVFTYTGTTLYVLDAVTGAHLTTMSIAPSAANSGCIPDSGNSMFVTDDGQIIFSCPNGAIFRIDASGKNEEGTPVLKIVWHRRFFIGPGGMPAPVLCPQPHPVTGQRVVSALVTGNTCNFIMGLNFATGAVLYNKTLEDSKNQPPSALSNFFLTLPAAGQHVYFSSPVALRCSVCTTGEDVWSTPAFNLTTPYIAAQFSPPLLVVGNDTGFIILRGDTGAIELFIDVGYQVWSDPLVAGNRLFAGAENGILYSYCLGELPETTIAPGTTTLAPASSSKTNPEHETIAIALGATVVVIVIVLAVVAFRVRRKKNAELREDGGGGAETAADGSALNTHHYQHAESEYKKSGEAGLYGAVA